jgi:hypothetical protein
VRKNGNKQHGVGCFNFLPSDGPNTDGNFSPKNDFGSDSTMVCHEAAETSTETHDFGEADLHN